MDPWDALRAEIEERRDTVHALEPGGPGGGAIGEPAFSQCQAFSIALRLIDQYRPVRISGAQEFPCPECGRPATISHATGGSARVTVSHPYTAGINEPMSDCEPLWVDVQASHHQPNGAAVSTQPTTRSSGGIGITGAVFIVFLVLKLVGVIDWSWWWVTSPLWISALIGIAFLVVFLIVAAVAK